MTFAPGPLWEGLSTADAAARWRAPRVLFFDRIGSTNDVIRKLAEEGAPAGTVAVADEQFAGRGRQGRRWSAPPGSALLASCLFRPAGHGVAPGALPLRVALHVARAVTDATGIDVGLKWPNDLVIAPAGKVAGILCEAVGAGSSAGYVVVGVGLNVTAAPPVVGDGALPATALADHGRAARGDVADAVIAALIDLCERPLTPLDGDERRAFDSRHTLVGAPVTHEGRTTDWIVRGVAPDGALLVDDAGTMRRVTAGTIRASSPPRVEPV